MKYLIIDTQNMFMRAVHVTKGDAEERGGMSIHIMLSSIAQAWRIFGADHVIFALECPNKDNWRRTVDSRYKVNREQKYAVQTKKEAEEADIMFGILNDLISFIKDRTNATVLRCPVAEADDMIARWVQLHPDDSHIIISSDKDFHQLIRGSVIQYDGVNRKLFVPKNVEITLDRKLDKDVVIQEIEDPDWLLFEKIIRGDASDNVFSAFPGARKKGTKNKVGIIDAFNDRERQGYNWHTFMNSKWTDHNGDDHIVKHDFERNTKLIDLASHPKNIQESMDSVIINETSKEPVLKVSIPFMKFCQKHQLLKILDRTDEFKNIFIAKY